MTDKPTIALLRLDEGHIDANFLVPTQVRKNMADEIEIGDPNRSSKSSNKNRFYKYSNFKADLTKTQEQLDIRSNWTMRSETTPVAVSGLGKPKRLMTPILATESYIGKLCESIIKKIHDSLGKGNNIKFYFSAPSFSQEQSSDEAKKISQNYRDRIRRILGKLNKQKALQGIEFPQNEATGKEKGFLYEQLGVFYYYTYCESQVDLTLPNATYLILDVGGSTTDIAIIQTRGEGKLSDAYPIHRVLVGVAVTLIMPFCMSYSKGKNL